MAAVAVPLAEAQRAVDRVLGDAYRVEVVGTAIVVTPGAGWSHNAVVAVEVVSPSNRDGGSGERYLQGRAEHGVTHGIEWLLGVDGDTVQWWRNGRPGAEGPPWAAGLRIDRGRVAGTA